jgi:hypothetical protein
MEQGYEQRHVTQRSRAELEARGREFADRFSWAENARRLLSLLNLPEHAVAGE